VQPCKKLITEVSSTIRRVPNPNPPFTPINTAPPSHSSLIYQIGNHPTMAYSSLLSLSLCLFVLFHGCFAQIEQVPWRAQRQQQQRFQTECRIDNLNAQEPSQRTKTINSSSVLECLWSVTISNVEACCCPHSPMHLSSSMLSKARNTCSSTS